MDKIEEREKQRKKEGNNKIEKKKGNFQIGP